MELEKIRDRGRNLGLNKFLVQGSRKILIQAIQREEGHQPCFLGDNRMYCKERGCEWRRDCLKLTAAWRR